MLLHQTRCFYHLSFCLLLCSHCNHIKRSRRKSIHFLTRTILSTADRSQIVSLFVCSWDFMRHRPPATQSLPLTPEHFVPLGHISTVQEALTKIWHYQYVLYILHRADVNHWCSSQSGYTGPHHQLERLPLHYSSIPTSHLLCDWMSCLHWGVFFPTKPHLKLIRGRAVLLQEYAAKYSATAWSTVLLNNFNFQGPFFSVRHVMFTNVSGVVPYSPGFKC